MKSFTLAEPGLLAAWPVLIGFVLLLELRAGPRNAPLFWRVFLRSGLLGLLLLGLAGPRRTEEVPLAPRLVVLAEVFAGAPPEVQRESDAALDVLAAEARRRGVALDTLRFAGEAAAPGASAPDEPALLAPRQAFARAIDRFTAGERGGVLALATGRGLGDPAAWRAETDARGIERASWLVPRAAPPPAGIASSLEAWAVPPSTRGASALPFVVLANVPLSIALYVDGRRVQAVDLEGSAEATRHEGAIALPELADGPHEVALEASTLGSIGKSLWRERRIVVGRSAPTIGFLFAQPEPSWLLAAAAAQELALVPWTGADDRPGQSNASPRALVADAAALVGLGPDALAQLAAAVRNGLGLVVEAGTDPSAWAALAGTPLAAVLPLRPLEEEKPPAPEPALPPPPRPEPPPEPPREQKPPDPGKGRGATRRADEALPISLVLLIDRSGSMEGEKFEMALDAASRAARRLGQSDRMAIVAFAEDASVVTPMRVVGPGANVGLWLSGLAPTGRATNIHAALAKAGQLLERESSPILHAILITDGHQSPPGPLFASVVAPLRRMNVTITAIGIGDEAGLEDLRDIVRRAAGGRVLYAPRASEVPTVVTRDTTHLVTSRDERAAIEGLLADPTREPAPAEPLPEPLELPPAEEPPPEQLAPTPPPPPPIARAALVPEQAHEALAGLADATWPLVDRPRPSEALPGSRTVLKWAGEPARPVLVAGRSGIGRVLVWSLPANDSTLRAWTQSAALGAQILAAALPADGSDAAQPDLVVRAGPSGRSMLEVGAASGIDEDAALELTWRHADGRTLALPSITPTREARRVELPRSAPGTRFAVEARFAGRDLAPLHAIVPDALPPDWPRVDEAALVSAIGPRTESLSAYVATLPWGVQERSVDRSLACVGLALLLLLLDVALHRRPVRVLA